MSKAKDFSIIELPDSSYDVVCNKEKGWPEEVPTLKQKDIVRGIFANENGTKHCLVGWRARVFGVDHARQVDKALSESAASLDKCNKHVLNLIGLNDDRKVSKSILATIWNRAMAILGYTEENPEGKYVEKKKKGRKKS